MRNVYIGPTGRSVRERLNKHIQNTNLSQADRYAIAQLSYETGHGIMFSRITVLHKRLMYLLARETFLIEDLRTNMILPRTNASEQLLTTLSEKREAIPEEFYGTGAMIDRQWTKESYELRHVITRLAVHGFHHHICKTTAYHEPNDFCECSLCGNKCERYHIELCSKRTKSIGEYAKL